MFRKSLLGLSFIVSLQAINVNNVAYGDVSLPERVNILEQALIKLIKKIKC